MDLDKLKKIQALSSVALDINTKLFFQNLPEGEMIYEIFVTSIQNKLNEIFGIVSPSAQKDLNVQDNSNINVSNTSRIIDLPVGNADQPGESLGFFSNNTDMKFIQTALQNASQHNT